MVKEPRGAGGNTQQRAVRQRGVSGYSRWEPWRTVPRFTATESLRSMEASIGVGPAVQERRRASIISSDPTTARSRSAARSAPTRIRSVRTYTHYMIIDVNGNGEAIFRKYPPLHVGKHKRTHTPDIPDPRNVSTSHGSGPCGRNRSGNYASPQNGRGTGQCPISRLLLGWIRATAIQESRAARRARWRGVRP